MERYDNSHMYLNTHLSIFMLYFSLVISIERRFSILGLFILQVSGTSLSGYSPHHTIAITYKFPSVIDGHGICSGQEIFSILLPNTTEGNEVFLVSHILKLF